MESMMMTKEQIVSLANNREVTEAATLDWDADVHEAAKGGLFDRDIFGEMVIGTVDSRGVLKDENAGEYPDSNWGYISLPVPVFHPSLVTQAAREKVFSTWADKCGQNDGDTNVCKELEAIIDFRGAVCFDTESPTFIPAKEADEGNGRDLAWGINALARLCGQDFVNRWCLTAIPVVPPAYRKIFRIEGSGKYALSDLNDLYLRVITRSNRIRRLQEVNVPDVIMRNETRVLQESVENLFMNGAKRPPVKDSNGHPLVPLANYFARVISPTASFIYAQAMCLNVHK